MTIVLAGGQGTRLRPLPPSAPKPRLPSGTGVGTGHELARGIRVWPRTRPGPTSVRFFSDV